MAKTKYTERLLIVFNPDGSLKGAAQYPLTTWDDPEIPDKQGDAEPVDPAALAGLLVPNQAAMFAQLSAALAENKKDDDEIMRLRGEIESKNAEIADRIKGKEALEAALSDKDAELAVLRAAAPAQSRP